MASIIKRKKNYSVVYNYVDENGETKQKWETWHTHKEALKRKAEIENQQHTGTFLPPSNQTITEFLYDFVSLYGEKKWGVSMYDGQTALIANYINPIIGDMEVQAVTPRAVDGYIQTLQKTKSVSTKTRKAVTTYVSDKTIEKIIKLLRCAFKHHHDFSGKPQPAQDNQLAFGADVFAGSGLPAVLNIWRKYQKASLGECQSADRRLSQSRGYA